MTVSLTTSEAAAVAEIAGRSVALRYSSIESEYAALHRNAILVDRTHRTRMTFEGDERAETLTGLVTNDVAALTPGSGLYAAALTPRGKIIADVRIFARQSDLLVDVPVRAAPGWLAMIRKYVNPRTTRYADKSDALADVGVFGSRARAIAAAVAGLSAEALGSLTPYAHVTTAFDGAPLLVARVPEIGVEGFELILPIESRPRLWRRAQELGAVPAGLDTWEVARIEAGRPEWGIDIDETTIPQEANFDEMHAISYTKGCYTGQETVARVHFRGHVNRHLRGLTYPGAEPLPRGAQLVDEADKAIGDVRSSAVSPRLGGVAIAMVRREIVPGTVVRARWEGGESSAVVLELPFPVDAAE
jgi:folate-binding protein YgfZ